MNTIEILKAARALITDPTKWVKGSFARSAKGRKCKATSKVAACFCAVGALQRVSGSTCLGTDVKFALNYGVNTDPRCNHYFGIPDFNDRDETTHTDVLAAFDRAIAHLEAE